MAQPTFCGTITEARVAARERRERKPQPWVVRKLPVAITLGIMEYVGYVYAGRFAVRLKHGGRRAEGIGLLVGWMVLCYCLLFLFLPSFLNPDEFSVIFTPPGTATDYVPKSSQPLFQPATRTQAEWDEYDRWRELDRQADNSNSHHPDADVDVSSFDFQSDTRMRLADTVYAIGSANADAQMPTPPPAAQRKSSGRGRWGRSDSNDQRRNENDATNGNTTGNGTITNGNTSGTARLPARARTTAPLLPPNRYCARCEIVKPHRAHHCRACGTCILKYDHHCPWIGQCVGARNHKFFINFLLATVFFTCYTLVSLIVFNTGGRWRVGREGGEGGVDAQEVVLVALGGRRYDARRTTLIRAPSAALFLLFTLPLGADHVRMVLSSQTTIKLTPPPLNSTKRRARRAHDAEWGALATEGNVWWVGSRRAAWEDVMGGSVWGWMWEACGFFGAEVVGEGVDESFWVKKEGVGAERASRFREQSKTFVRCASYRAAEVWLRARASSGELGESELYAVESEGFPARRAGGRWEFLREVERACVRLESWGRVSFTLQARCASYWAARVPIGAPLGDGLHYVPNPRFDASGRWRRRSEWPVDAR
ncbi:DHHC palmitoyltransferase-domain-containing protein [Mycena haematopus]|nr:DHHC palmitoyltransferase-domain-containing protein [Mycena haematopus]